MIGVRPAGEDRVQSMRDTRGMEQNGEASFPRGWADAGSKPSRSGYRGWMKVSTRTVRARGLTLIP